ncbi:Protein artemis [Papilio machaon]|uniref:Protein artemis n=1 Tax=Papilio machaon TaxID=76193 RepID=A0A0N1PGZ1_PAPMA|nr:Protein artemis [Papilio machaon]
MKKCPSSFDKTIEEIPGIAVDNFEGQHLNSRAFFLSHYHMDHVQGLDSPQLANHLRETNTFIYTSEITASIINHEMECSDILKYVKPLGRASPLPFPHFSRIGKGGVVCLLERIRTERERCLCASPPGAIIDSQYTINDISKYGKLHKNNEPINIDAMYLDTTFFDEKYKDFSKRTDTADAVIHEIDKWLKIDKRNAISIFMYANYTFEFLLNKIYERLKMKVYVNEFKWDFYSKIQHLVPSVTNDADESKIHLCRNKFEYKNHNSCLPYDCGNRNYFHIHLTAQKWDDYNLDESPIVRRSSTSLDAYCQAQTKKYVEKVPPSKYSNPNFVRDRLKNIIVKPFINETWQNRFDKPFHPAWMDYCDPYHCNDYHKTACGLNRKRMRFKWFQSGCHIALNNLCAAFRGNLKYDMIEAKYCIHYTIFLRSGCPASCNDDEINPVCAVSSIDNHVVLFKNICALDTANCRQGVFQEYDMIEAKYCIHYTIFLRSGCPASCNDDEINPVCAVSSIDNHVVLFKNTCALDTANCRQGVFQALINNVLGPTPSVRERIAILKSKLLNDGHAAHPSIYGYYGDTSDDYENRNFLIEPITRKKKYKNYKVKTNTTPISNVTRKTNSLAKRQGLRPFLKSEANTKKKDKLFLNPMDIFYRRVIGEQFKDESWKWALCQDIITPYLTGVKKRPMEMSKIGLKDAAPERMFHLLSINMSEYAKEDVFALMYQISKVQIRLYQWDVMPIRVLINLLVKGRV